MQDLKKGSSTCWWCHNKCYVQLHVRDGRLEKMVGDPNHPDADALRRNVAACTRAVHGADIVHHPGRLNFPLKRLGERGEGKWQEISWEQALDEIAAKLAEIRDKYGAEAVASSGGTGRTYDEYRVRFFNLFGSPNFIGQSKICFGPQRVVGYTITGWPVGRTRMIKKTKCIMIIGSNPEQAFRRRWFSFRNSQKDGGKIIVIDPRETVPAKKADIWAQIRPGTDTALFLAMINVIIEENLYDKEFVDKWCYGFNELKEHVRDFSPEKMADVTWIPAEKIREIARMYATVKPATIMSGMGVEHSYNSIEALHCLIILPAITGNLGVSGGQEITEPHNTFIPDPVIELNDMLPPEKRAKEIGAERFKLQSLRGYDLLMKYAKAKGVFRYGMTTPHEPSVYRAMITGQPYPIKAMITLSSNPMVTMANTKLVYKALRSLDLYVVSDFFMTPSAALADYVLPAAMWPERPNIWHFNGTAPFLEVGVALLPAKVEGQFERKNDYEFWCSLGRRLGQEEYWPWDTLEEAFDYRLSPLGKTLKQLAAEGGVTGYVLKEKLYEEKGFGTPTGKVELGYNPLPHFHEPPESPINNPELAREYPLILITGGRHLPFFHSEFRQVDSLRKQHPHPITQINPETASKLGIEDGEWVWIETVRGRIRQKCRLDNGIRSGVVHAQHGWWFPELPGEEPWLHGVWESNINVVTNDDPDVCNPINGGWPLRAALCKVYKVKNYGD
ncbi:MAG: molybdopterin-dependent oxidoreductase [Actinobacteria bacterium]|nr:molybdopterin-dependent oxidoreductase [Actinomycetota bacterium]